VYSTAEYRAPVWSNSTHSGKVDMHLNSAMQLINGVVQSTPISWLPVLSNIASPEIRRDEAFGMTIYYDRCLQKLNPLQILRKYARYKTSQGNHHGSRPEN